MHAPRPGQSRECFSAAPRCSRSACRRFCRSASCVRCATCAHVLLSAAAHRPSRRRRSGKLQAPSALRMSPPQAAASDVQRLRLRCQCGTPSSSSQLCQQRSRSPRRTSSGVRGLNSNTVQRREQRVVNVKIRVLRGGGDQRDRCRPPCIPAGSAAAFCSDTVSRPDTEAGRSGSAACRSPPCTALMSPVPARGAVELVQAHAAVFRNDARHGGFAHARTGRRRSYWARGRFRWRLRNTRPAPSRCCCPHTSAEGARARGRQVVIA